MKNLWEVWEGALSAEYCEYVIKKSIRHPAQTAAIGFNPNAPPDLNYRTSTIRWLDTRLSDADIAETMMKFVKLSNRNNFGFDLTCMNEIQFTEYHGSENGKYDWHHDVFWENQAPYDRKLSIVIQLSKPEDYEGGKFEFFGIPCPDNFIKQGSILVFPSFFLHRVLPVTKGTRYSLVSWVEGPKFR